MQFINQLGSQHKNVNTHRFMTDLSTHIQELSAPTQDSD